MSQDASWKENALEAVLTSMTAELEAALELAALPDATARFDEVARRCSQAAALAEAGQLLAARTDWERE